MSLITCIQDQSDYYRRLKKELEDEVKINNELNSTKTQRDEITQLLDMKQTQVIALEKQSKKEYEEVRKLRHLSFKSAAATLSGKKKELKAKEEAGYQLAFENEQRAKRELESLSEQLNDTVAREKGLKKQKHQFNESRAQLNALLDQIFESDDPTFPQDSQIKAEIKNYHEQRQMAKKDKGRFSDAEDQLLKASMGTKKTIQLLGRTVNYEPFDIFGTPLLEEEQIRDVEASKKKLWEIQRLLNAVRTFLPEIPHPQTLDVITNNPLLYSQPSWNYFDQAWKVKAVQCIGQLNAVHQNIQNSIGWTKQYKHYAEGAIDRLATAIESAKSRLEAERCRKMDAILGESSGGLDLIVDTGHNLPPPVYEAPASSSPKSDNHLPVIPSAVSLLSNETPLLAPQYTSHSIEPSQNENSNNPFHRPQQSANGYNPFTSRK